MAAIIATAALHNIARLNREAEPPQDQEFDQQRLQQLLVDGHIPVIPHNNNQDGDGYDVRTEFINNYFGRRN